jgi:hypothetical protein
MLLIYPVNDEQEKYLPPQLLLWKLGALTRMPFDWVLLSDADEYLWFNGKIGVKDSSSQPSTRSMTISHSASDAPMKHRVNATTTGFNQRTSLHGGNILYDAE